MSDDSLQRSSIQTEAKVCEQGTAIFSVHNLSFAYTAQKKQLDKVDFALFPGQSVGLMGANGAGKTTFFRCITGLCKPDEGGIFLRGKPVVTGKDFFELRRQVGYALQNAEDQLFFPTVVEDVAFGPLNLGLSNISALERARESLTQVGLEGYENRLSHQLSGGEKRLVALASILAMHPAALLLDEPLNGLDEEAQERITHVLTHLDCAKLIIAHERSFLQKLCSSLYVLEQGHLNAEPV